MHDPGPNRFGLAQQRGQELVQPRSNGGELRAQGREQEGRVGLEYAL